MFDRLRVTRTGLLSCVALSILGYSSSNSLAANGAVDNVGPVDIGGYSLWLDCRGAGDPTVIVDGGAGTWSTHYMPVQQSLVSTARTCLYDRAGLGQSDAGPEPRSSSVMVDELHRLLAEAGESPPYVLVGHSMGGYNVRIFQNRFPEDVSALVLVDSAHPEQWERLPPTLKELVIGAIPMFDDMATMAEAGQLTRDAIDKQVAQSFPPEVRKRLIDAGLEAKTYQGTAVEFEAALRSGPEVPGTKLGDLPLVVLTARNSAYAYDGMGVPTAEANSAWQSLQEELVALSSRSAHLFSEGTHALHETHPEDVAEAVRSAIRMVKSDDR